LAVVITLWTVRPAGASGEAADACAPSVAVAGQVESGVADPADVRALLSRIEAACAEGFPAAPFEGKLAEGLAKKVPPARIVRTLDAKLEAFRGGAAMLRDCGAPISPEILTVVGEGMFGEAPPAMLRDYVCAYAARQAGPFLTGLEMTLLLHRAGFDYGLTRTLLDAGFESGSLAAPWRYFVRVVLVARQRGVADETVTRTAIDVVRGGGSPSDVSARLGFTDRDLSGRTLDR
jgi:hypothetical protein